MNWEANKLPLSKALRIDIRKDRNTLYQALLLYKSQQYLTFIKDYYRAIRKKDYEELGMFNYADMGKFYNF